MEYRSSNAGQHISNDIVAGVGSSCGVQLRGGATVATVSAVGDNTDIGLTLAPKGAGGVQIGGNSTTPISLFQRYFVQFTVPALSSGASAESTVTVSGLTTNSLVYLQNRLKLNSTVTGVIVTGRCSTADELTIEYHNISQSSLSGSTQSAYLFQFGF